MISKISVINNFNTTNKTNFKANNINKKVSFGALENEGDSFQKTSTHTDPWAAEKIKLMNEAFNKPLKEMQACVRYFKGEDTDMCNQAKRDIEKVTNRYVYNSDFLLEDLEVIKHTNSPFKRELLVGESASRFESLADDLRETDFDELQREVNDIRTDVLQKCVNNCQTAHNYCYKKLHNVEFTDDLVNKDTLHALNANRDRMTKFFKDLPVELIPDKEIDSFIEMKYKEISDSINAFWENYKVFCNEAGKYVYPRDNQ